MNRQDLAAIMSQLSTVSAVLNCHYSRFNLAALQLAGIEPIDYFFAKTVYSTVT